MATRLARATGNFTNAATWGVVDATALLVANSNNTTLTASYVTSQTFTPGAIEIDGIAVWVNTRPGSSGTISVALDQGGGTVAGTEVTIDVADIPSAGSCWVLFKFAAPMTLLAATAYSVKAKTSGTNAVSLFRNSTAGNWSRLLRTTTTGAPGASDDLYVIGEKTGSGTGAAITVTMDNTAATVFAAVDLNSGGKLAYGTSASTAYLLTLAGNLNVRSDGEFNIGTKAGTAMPSTSTGELAFSNASNVDRGVEIIGSGIFRTAGAAIANPWALLDADASASATSLTTNISTGWKNGDLIGIASTTRTASECESKSLTADASGTTLTIAALTNAHGGNLSTLVTAELVNLTRNVKIHGTSTSLQAYINQGGASSVVELEATEIYWMGSSTSNKRGINLSQTTGSFYAQYCAFRDFAVASSMILRSTSANNIDFQHNVLYNLNSGAWFDTSTSNVVISDVVLVRVPSSADGLILHSSHTVSDIRVAGVNSGTALVTETPTSFLFTGTWSGSIVVHSCGGGAWSINTLTASTVTSFPSTAIWRCSSGLLLNGSYRGLTFDGFTSFGHASESIRFHGAPVFNVTFKDFDIRAGATLTCPVGVSFTNNLGSPRASGLYFVNGSFGGSSQTHATADIQLGTTGCLFTNFVLDNVAFNSSTQLQNQTDLPFSDQGPPVSTIRMNFLGQTQNHRTWLGNGTWSYDTSIADATPSLRMTPLSASIKLQSPGFLASVANGQTKTASVKVRKSVSGDGAAYNGNQPRLMVRRNYGAGITADTVLDTATAAAEGAFETLSGVTAAVSADCALEFYVDCDGTAGWVNVDTFAVS